MNARGFRFAVSSASPNKGKTGKQDEIKMKKRERERERDKQIRQSACSLNARDTLLTQPSPLCSRQPVITPTPLSLSLSLSLSLAPGLRKMRDTGCIRLLFSLLPLTRPLSDYYTRVKSLAKSCFDRWALITPNVSSVSRWIHLSKPLFKSGERRGRSLLLPPFLFPSLSRRFWTMAGRRRGLTLTQLRFGLVANSFVLAARFEFRLPPKWEREGERAESYLRYRSEAKFPTARQRGERCRKDNWKTKLKEEEAE